MIYLHLPYGHSGAQHIQSLLASNQQALLSRGYLYPSTSLLQDAHNNLYYEAIESPDFRPELGGLHKLSANLLKFKIDNPDAHIVISADRLIHCNITILYKIIDALSQIDEITCIISLTNPVRYLNYIYQKLSLTADRLPAKEAWIKKVINANDYGIKFDNTVIKIEKLVNEKSMRLLNLDEDEVTNIKQHLDAFDIRDRRFIDFGNYTSKGANSAFLDKENVHRNFINEQLQAGLKYISSKYLPEDQKLI